MVLYSRRIINVVIVHSPNTDDDREKERDGAGSRGGDWGG